MVSRSVKIRIYASFGLFGVGLAFMTYGDYEGGGWVYHLAHPYQEGQCLNSFGKMLEEDYYSPDEIYGAYQSGTLDCVPREGEFLDNFLQLYNTPEYPCSYIDIIVRYPITADFIRAVDSGEEQCEIPANMQELVNIERIRMNAGK